MAHHGLVRRTKEWGVMVLMNPGNRFIRSFRFARAIAMSVLVCAGAPPAPVRGQCDPRELATLCLSDTVSMGDTHGSLLAISDDTAVVGAPSDDAGGSNAGAAYVFVKPPGGWATMTETAKLTASDATENDEFGRAVAVSGDTVVVGASWDDDSGNNSGSAYVFVRSGTVWSEQQKLIASDAAAGDEFGYSVAIEGDTAVVGAWRKNSWEGAAYVFTRSGTVWTQAAKLRANPFGPNRFVGFSMAISGDTVVAGAPLYQNGAGAAYVFVKPAGGWSGVMSQTARLMASFWQTNDFFGRSVALSGDTAVVGAPGVDGGGLASVFTKPAGGWANMTETAKLNASDVGNLEFGRFVAASGDTVLVGSGFGSHVHIFVKPDGGWMSTSETGQVTSNHFMVAVSGNTAVVYTANNCSTTVFDLLPATHPGDIDGDHDVDGDDTALFADVLIGLDTDIIRAGRADVDCSGTADGLDVAPFVDLLLN